MTKTEELRVRLEVTVNQFMRPSIHKHSKVYNVSQLTDQILKACKKAGLVFRNDFDGCDWFDEHDLTHGCSVWDYCPAIKALEPLEIK